MKNNLVLIDPTTGDRMKIVFVNDRRTGQPLKPIPFFLVRESDTLSGGFTSDKLIHLTDYPGLLPKVNEAIKNMQPGKLDDSFLIVSFEPF